MVAQLYPDSMRPGAVIKNRGPAATATPSPEAHLEEGVIIEPYAVIGAACTSVPEPFWGFVVIGPGVQIGRTCSIGAHSSIFHAAVGNYVIVHPGVRVGQDGFGFCRAKTVVR